MTVAALQKEVQDRLTKGGCDSPAFDAVCLLEDLGGIGRGRVPMGQQTVLSDAVCETVLNAADRRAAGEPLQYLLGNWDFLELTLAVGPGVLIPRPETELLCQTAVEVLRQQHGTQPVTVLDLCAGSGCVGLGVASLYSSASVIGLELSETAFTYFEKNCARYPQLQVQSKQADVLAGPDGSLSPVDAIVSNPPYIPTEDLSGLQREVQREPRMALDGGDGLVFYRAIAERWISLLKPHGFVAVEIGIGQETMVSKIFSAAGLQRIAVYPDFAGIPRVVVAYK